jgi:hypothetical protein
VALLTLRQRGEFPARLTRWTGEKTYYRIGIMSKENAATSETKEAKSGLRIAQVMAAALAAVTAALLGSTLGVAGPSSARVWRA